MTVQHAGRSRWAAASGLGLLEQGHHVVLGHIRLSRHLHLAPLSGTPSKSLGATQVRAEPPSATKTYHMNMEVADGQSAGWTKHGHSQRDGHACWRLFLVPRSSVRPG